MTNNTDKQRPLGTWIPLCKTSQIVFFGFCFVVFLLFGFRLFGLIGSDFSLNSVILVLVCAYGSPVDRDNVWSASWEPFPAVRKGQNTGHAILPKAERSGRVPPWNLICYIYIYIYTHRHTYTVQYAMSNINNVTAVVGFGDGGRGVVVGVVVPGWSHPKRYVFGQSGLLQWHCEGSWCKVCCIFPGSCCHAGSTSNRKVVVVIVVVVKVTVVVVVVVVVAAWCKCKYRHRTQRQRPLCRQNLHCRWWHRGHSRHAMPSCRQAEGHGRLQSNRAKWWGLENRILSQPGLIALMLWDQSEPVQILVHWIVFRLQLIAFKKLGQVGANIDRRSPHASVAHDCPVLACVQPRLSVGHLNRKLTEFLPAFRTWSDVDCFLHQLCTVVQTRARNDNSSKSPLGHEKDLESCRFCKWFVFSVSASACRDHETSAIEGMAPPYTPWKADLRIYALRYLCTTSTSLFAECCAFWSDVACLHRSVCWRKQWCLWSF